MSNSTQITENLLTAVDIVVEEKLRVLDFDRTEQYTITDNTKASDRIYTVSDGQVSFEAYAISNSDEYKIGDTVVVSIPKSNFSNPEKTILRLATKADSDETGRISYPFDQILDVSGNLLQYRISNNRFGLVANHYDESKANSYENFRVGDTQYLANNGTEARPQAIRIVDITDENILRYTNTCPYIGLSAKFTVPLGQGLERVVSGDYGLKLTLYLDGYNNRPAQVGYITNEDMFGDPYNYVVGAIEQKILYFQYNRTEKSQPEHQITRITIDFFQGGNFYNYQGELYNMDNNQTTDPAFANGALEDLLIDNIFVDELYLCSAFDKDSYVENKVEISSSHDIVYEYDDGKDAETADVSISWLYCGDALPRLVFEKPKDTISVRWYAYALGKQDDNYGGMNWSFIKESNNFDTSIILPKDLGQYEVKAVIVDTDNSYTSYNTLQFINREYIELYQPEQDLILKYSDNYNGTYPLYNLLNEITDPAQAMETRTLTPQFISGATLSPSMVTQVRWIVPLSSQSMLTYLNDGAALGGTTNQYQVSYSADGSYIIYTRDVDKNTFEILAIGPAGSTAIKEAFSLRYKIKDELKYNTDAHISCELQVAKMVGELADRPHYAVTDMQFMQEGTSGSPYTLIIRSKDGKVLTYVDGSTGLNEGNYNIAAANGLHTITLETYLIGEDGKLIEFSNGVSTDGNYNISYDWRPIDNFEPTLTIDSTLGIISLPISYSTNSLSKNYHIARVTISPTNDGEEVWQRNITGYYAVPIRRNLLDDNFSGTTTVIYNSEGSLLLENQAFYPLHLDYNSTNTDHFPLKYELVYSNNLRDVSLTEDNTIEPSPFYLTNYDTYGVTVLVRNSGNTLLWSQPILIYQQDYFSALINKWDGKLVVDEDNNYILSAAMGAGTKDSNNKFTGVLLGNVAHVEGNTERSITTGVYGFKDGDQVFAFKEDGTAFIGSGNGRLNFDGNDARIYNSAMVYANGQSKPDGRGLMIDFDDGLIHTSNIYTGQEGDEDRSERQRHVFINGFDPNYPLAIGNITYNKNSDSAGGQIDVSKANFYVDWDGNLKLSGSITPTGKAEKDLINLVTNSDSLKGILNNVKDELQDQIDGSIDTYYFPGYPEAQVWFYEPGIVTGDILANEWKDDGKNHSQHFYVASNNKVWAWDPTTNSWNKDEDSVKSLLEAVGLTYKYLTEDVTDNTKQMFATKHSTEGIEWYYGKDEDNVIKERHIGDLYLDTVSGLGYRLLKNGDNYSWEPLNDAALQRALTDAARAQSTADGKATVYYFGDYEDPLDEDKSAGRDYQNGDICFTNKGVYVWVEDEATKIGEWVESHYGEDYASLSSSIGKLTENLKEYIDSEIDIFVGEGMPTSDKVYGSGYTVSDSDIGDIYYDTKNEEVYVLNKNGNSYNWVKSDNVSNATIEALKTASQASDLADGKRRIFYQNTAPSETNLDNGDLWVNGTIIQVWDGTSWTNADNYNGYTNSQLEKLVTGKYVYDPGNNLDNYFIDGDIIYSPRIFGGTTLGVGYNGSSETRSTVQAAASATAGTSLGDDITKPSQWLLKDSYNFRVYPTGGIGIGPVSLSSTDTTNARYNFMVDNKGNVFANNGVFKGAITATSLELGDKAKNVISSMIPDAPDLSDYATKNYVDNATASVAGSNIILTKSGNTVYAYVNKGLDSNNNLIYGDLIYKADADGALIAENAFIEGQVTATSGYIGGWQIRSKAAGASTHYGDGALYYNNGWWVYDSGTNDYLSPKDGTIIFSSGDTINGDVTSSEGDSYTVKGIRVAGSGTKKDWRLIIGPNFGVDSTGTLYANNATVKGSGNFSGAITASSGSIGGWAIKPVSSGSTHYGAGALYYDNGWWVTDSGTNDYLSPKDGTIIFSPNDTINGDVTSSEGTSYTVKGIRVGKSETKKNWRLIVGSNFGVDSAGIMYANNGNFAGNIDLASSTIKSSTGDALGGIAAGEGYNGNSYTDGILMYAGSSKPSDKNGVGNYIITTESGARMTSNYGNISASVYAAGDSCVMSTRNNTNPTQQNQYNCNLTISPSDGLYFFKAYNASTSYSVQFIDSAIKLQTSSAYRAEVNAGNYVQLQQWSDTSGRYLTTQMTYGSSSISVTSDIRLKENIKDFSKEKSLDFITSIEPFLFQYTDNDNSDENYHLGYSAQEVDAYYHFFFPELADKKLLVTKESENDYYSFAMGNLIPHMTFAIAKLKDKNDELKNQVESLTLRLSNLETLLQEKGVI